MKKKFLYLAGIIVIGAMILTLLGAIIVPKIQAAVARSQSTTAREKIIGSWRADAFGGQGSKWVHFYADGTCSLYQEVSAADGQSIYQDSSSYGQSSWEMLSPSRIRIQVSVLGHTETQDFDIQLADDGRSLILGEDTYIKQ